MDFRCIDPGTKYIADVDLDYLISPNFRRYEVDGFVCVYVINNKYNFALDYRNYDLPDFSLMFDLVEMLYKV